MATYGRKLVDVNGNVILPKTRSSLVYMNNNETVEDTISKIISGKTVVGKATYATSAGSAVDQTARDTANAAKTTAAAAMPKTGGTFSGGVTFNAASTFSAVSNFNKTVNLNAGATIGTDRSPGNGVYVQPMHIPNISAKIKYVILWT